MDARRMCIYLFIYLFVAVGDSIRATRHAVHPTSPLGFVMVKGEDTLTSPLGYVSGDQVPLAHAVCVNRPHARVARDVVL